MAISALRLQELWMVAADYGPASAGAAYLALRLRVLSCRLLLPCVCGC